MNATATARRTALALAALATLGMLVGVNALSSHEYERAVIAQAAATQVAHADTASSAPALPKPRKA